MSISTRSIAIFVAAGLALSVGASFIVSRALSTAVSKDVQQRVIDLIFDSVVAGPLTFARLHSSAIANKQLARLMTTPALKERGVFGVTILGGENKQFEYAKWLAQVPSESKCIHEIRRNYEFPDSMHPFEIKISVDSCTKFGEREEILNYSVLANMIVVCIAAFLLFIAIFPMVSSVQKAEQALDANGRDRINGISLTSIRSLVEKAMQAAELEKESAISGIARQVAHDIRSPLSALNLVTAHLSEVSEEKRTLIRNAAERINDIANNLLKQSKGTLGKSLKSSQKAEKVETMLVSIIDSLVSEKRIQFRNQMNVQIEVNLNEGYGLFAKINAGEISRVLSNLINNSCEAIDKNGGKVTVNLLRQGNFACIQIIDTGKGIPPEILKMIGQRGFSYGKENSASGSGLGISHAIEVLKDVGGHFEIESMVGLGTRIQLKIPTSSIPSWFVRELSLKEQHLVISVDDDRTIHQIWHKRLSDFIASGKIFHVEFSSPASFEAWYSSPEINRPEMLLLVDFEFAGNKINGLELIQKHHLENKSILVTSHFDEAFVKLKSEELGIKMIPKSLSPLIPISLT